MKTGVKYLVYAALLLSAFSLFTAVWLFTKLEDEGEQRRNQACTIFETKQKADVDALKRTYDYLAGLDSDQLREPLNRTVLAGLPRVVREAKIDDAPPYCDEEGIGLPEPDPVLPDRPLNLPAAR